jgi:hypothetical protein
MILISPDLPAWRLCGVLAWQAFFTPRHLATRPVIPLAGNLFE